MNDMDEMDEGTKFAYILMVIGIALIIIIGVIMIVSEISLENAELDKVRFASDQPQSEKMLEQLNKIYETENSTIAEKEERLYNELESVKKENTILKHNLNDFKENKHMADNEVTQWEYLDTGTDFRKNKMEYIDYLNERGKEGWELTPNKSAGGSILKRPKKNRDDSYGYSR